ncbi:hypothetical protein HMPREF3190_01097 [Umbribacter vaginalis]|nr:hypothetical protein HMPREF3190_01097 [Coriobacteriales bacterium DNF00809]
MYSLISQISHIPLLECKLAYVYGCARCGRYHKLSVAFSVSFT